MKGRPIAYDAVCNQPDAAAPLVSVIINNYNYGRFLGPAIDSALHQTYRPLEVIVVDDGSTDNSHEVIAQYGTRISTVLKKNGGQASAFNEGFRKSRGDMVIFLDSDDLLRPDAAETAISRFSRPDIVKTHWPMTVIDEDGHALGFTIPDGPLASGDLRASVFRSGPATHVSAPTSGNAWSRWFLEKIFPVPEPIYRINADKFLFELAPFFGTVDCLKRPIGQYRKHGRNKWATTDFGAQLERELFLYENYSDVARRYCEEIGVAVDVTAWKANSWWHRQQLALQDLSKLSNVRGSLILIDEGSWGSGLVAGRARLPFMERGGEFAGRPANDEEAIRELERLRLAGASHLAFVWSCFWWIDHYKGLTDYLRLNFRCVLENEYLVIFDLQ